MGFNLLTGRNAGLAGLRHPQLFSRAWQIAPADIGVSARQAYLEEGTPLRPSGSVDLKEAVWLPPDIHRHEL